MKQSLVCIVLAFALSPNGNEISGQETQKQETQKQETQKQDNQPAERSDFKQRYRQGNRNNRPGRGGGRGRGQSDANRLMVGEPAPDFKLQSLDGKSQTHLAALRSKKPVILFFGSYT